MSKLKDLDSSKGAAAAAGRTAGKRKPYQAPRLQAYGSVAKLTGTKSGSPVDGGMPMTVCL